jgi:nucleoside-diphosphate-sugar epimerase
MLKLALIGANGQVGAELCLLLAGHPDLALVPVCRNRSGSAFLRWNGIACRHGRIADSAEAPRLIADCDVVVNCSLATGTPAEIRRTEDRIIRNLFAHSKTGATIIHFSTQSVYGDPTPGRRVRWRNPYGRGKLGTESTVRHAQRRFGKPAYVLRLGHVCGGWQEISATIRAQLKANEVVLPRRDCSSNAVYTVAIVDAIRRIVGGDVEPGTYDLMNTPRWTWNEIYAFEAKVAGVPFSPTIVGSNASSPGAIRGGLVAVAATLGSNRWLLDVFSKFFAHLPAAANARAQAWWYRRRARTEISALHHSSSPAEHLSWVENGVRFFPAMTPTRELLTAALAPLADGGRPITWVADLPDAAPTSPQ